MSPADAAGRQSHSLLLISFLMITAILSGAMVMVIEVLGSRVLTPFFGASLFVWTSLITVTLVALAVGYAAGGIFSDKKSNPGYLYGIIFIAGILVLLIPQTKSIILTTFMPLGLRSGSLLSSTLLFGPSLFLLGCVSPFIVKIAAREIRNVGRTVGIFYSISTIGSFLGTVLTGFVLIAYFSVDRIFQFVGFSLVCLSVFYFVIFGKQWFVALILVLSPLVFDSHVPVRKIRASGTKVTEMFSSDTFYGNVKVVDYSFEEKHTRELMIDGLMQSGIDMRSRESIFGITYFLEFLPYGVNPFGKKCLVLGLGAGVVPMWYEERGIMADVVEINQKVVDIAEKYFAFKISGDMIVEDARYYLMNTQKKYDYIIVDVASGDVYPSHVFSIEAFQLIKRRLADNGILSMNIIGSTSRDTMITASIIKTLQAVFSVVKMYPTVPPQADTVQNLVVVAYNNPALSFSADRVNSFPVHPFVRPLVRELLGKEFVFPYNTPSLLLSDNFNPIDFLGIWVKEQLRKQSLLITDHELLI